MPYFDLEGSHFYVQEVADWQDGTVTWSIWESKPFNEVGGVHTALYTGETVWDALIKLCEAKLADESKNPQM